MKTHTPGPWANMKAGEVVGPDEMPVAYASVFRMDNYDVRDASGQASANARLIAAAPEMLAALQEAEEGLALSYQVCDYPANGNSQQDRALAVVRAAIAKATGAA